MLFLWASENRIRFTAVRQFLFKNLPVLQDTHILRLSEASGHTLPREVVGAVVGLGGWCWWPFHILPCEASGRRQQKCGSGFTARGDYVEGSCSSAGMHIPPDGSSWANLYLTSARFSSFRPGNGLASLNAGHLAGCVFRVLWDAWFWDACAHRNDIFT